VTFLHVAAATDADPLGATAAFGAFRAGLGERCVAAPAPAQGTLIGSYGLNVA
jgi:hypothetical protein